MDILILRLLHILNSNSCKYLCIFLENVLKMISKSLSETMTSFRNFCSCTFIWGKEMAINLRRTVTKGICFRTLFEQKYIVGSPGVQVHYTLCSCVLQRTQIKEHQSPKRQGRDILFLASQSLFGIKVDIGLGVILGDQAIMLLTQVVKVTFCE